MHIRSTIGVAPLLGLSLAWCGCCTSFIGNQLHAQQSGATSRGPGGCCSSFVGNHLHDQGVVRASRCYLLSIEGMSCEHCAGHVKDALLKVPGVAAAKVDYAKAQAEVCIQPGFTVTGEMLVKAVEKAGYKARVNRKEGVLTTADPVRQVVFKVEGLTCPAVEGLGCGHRIAPVLARLNKIEGVEKSFANRAGTMIRIAVAPSADPDKVAAAVRDDLIKDNRKPILLRGEELQQALMQEKWGSPGELSAIEFRTLVLHRIKVFAESEKLDNQAADKLLKLAAQQWDRMSKGEDGGKGCCAKELQPSDWWVQCQQFAAAFPEQAKGLLTTEQVERLKQVLTRRFQEQALPLPADVRQKE